MGRRDRPGEAVSTLTPAQQAAIDAELKVADGVGDRIAVTAGAGAGKTAVLTRRVARLISDGITPESILVVTFTRAAAAEMRARLATIVPSHRRLPEIRTLHSWCARFLRANAELVNRTPSFSIYDEADVRDVLRVVAAEVGDDLGERFDAKRVLKNPAYRDRFVDRLRLGNALTYDQLERFAVKILAENDRVRDRVNARYRHVLVDEVQDLSEAQESLLGNLGRYNTTLFGVGDERQAIYSFRGGTPAVMARLAAERSLVLPENFRSVSAIVDLANAVAGAGAHPMRPTRSDAGAVRLLEADDEVQEAGRVLAQLRAWNAAGIPWSDMAVIGRTWSALEAFRSSFVGASPEVPHRYYGEQATDLWSTAEGRAVARLAGLAENPADDNLALLLAQHVGLDARALAVAARRERRTLLAKIAEQNPAWATVAGATSIVGCSLLHEWIAGVSAGGLTSRAERYEAAATYVDRLGRESFLEWWTDRGVMDRKADASDGVAILTAHAAKGLEWRAVAVVGADCYPMRAARTDEEIREERRVLYVALTRARDELLVSYPRRRVTPSGGTRSTSAPFLDGLEALWMP